MFCYFVMIVCGSCVIGVLCDPFDLRFQCCFYQHIYCCRLFVVCVCGCACVFVCVCFVCVCTCVCVYAGVCVGVFFFVRV